MIQNVLVMDDSPVIRNLVKRSLKMAGLTPTKIFEASNGHEGLGVLMTESVDLVLMDLNMPEMTGYEFVARIDPSPRLGGIPLVVISTERSEARLSELLTRPTRKYLPKPFTPESLKRAIAELFGEASGKVA
jgi:two-component system chemotaxis response regulator CheY